MLIWLGWYLGGVLAIIMTGDAQILEKCQTFMENFLSFPVQEVYMIGAENSDKNSSRICYQEF